MYNVQLNRFEKRQQHVVSLWWIPPFVRINESAKEEIKEHDAIELGTICIYTAGSGIDGYIKAAATAPVLQISGIRMTKMEYIDTSTTSIVYTAELRGMVLALQRELLVVVDTDLQLQT
jgi:hypothetical protein